MTPTLTAALLILANTSHVELAQNQTMPTLGAMDDIREMDVHVVIEGPDGHIRVVEDDAEYEMHFDQSDRAYRAALQRMMKSDRDHHSLQEFIRDLVRQGDTPRVNPHQMREMMEVAEELRHRHHDHRDTEQWLEWRDDHHEHYDDHHHQSEHDMHMMRRMEEYRHHEMHDHGHHEMHDDYAAQAMQFAHKIEVSREIGARLEDKQAMAIFGVWQAREHVEPDRRIGIMRSIAYDHGVHTAVRNAAEWVLMEAYWQVGDEDAAADTLETFIRRNGS